MRTCMCVCMWDPLAYVPQRKRSLINFGWQSCNKRHTHNITGTHVRIFLTLGKNSRRAKISNQLTQLSLHLLIVKSGMAKCSIHPSLHPWICKMEWVFERQYGYLIAGLNERDNWIYINTGFTSEERWLKCGYKPIERVEYNIFWYYSIRTGARNL